MTRPFRFAVQTSHAADAGRWRDLARRAEDLGYATLYIPDHFDEQWAPTVALTAAAGATSSLRVGSLVLNAELRNPVALAREAATLAVVSEGRFDLGIGAGWLTSDFTQAGVPFEPAGRRLDRLVDTIDIVQGLLHDGEISHDGRQLRVEAATSAPPVPAAWRPPLVLGGSRERMLRLAGARADVVSVLPDLGEREESEERTLARCRWVAEGVARRGSDDGRDRDVEMQCILFALSVTDRRKSFHRAVARQMGISDADAAAIPSVLGGSIEEMCETLHRRRELYGFSHVVVHDPDMDEFAPVVEALSGV